MACVTIAVSLLFYLVLLFVPLIVAAPMQRRVQVASVLVKPVCHKLNKDCITASPKSLACAGTAVSRPYYRTCLSALNIDVKRTNVIERYTRQLVKIKHAFGAARRPSSRCIARSTEKSIVHIRERVERPPKVAATALFVERKDTVLATIESSDSAPNAASCRYPMEHVMGSVIAGGIMS
jgi:hypothetical protein